MYWLGRHKAYIPVGCFSEINPPVMTAMVKSQLLHVVLGITAVLLGIYAVLSLLLFFLQAHLIYFPEARIIATPAERGLPYESVDFKTEDGVDLNGWYIAGGSDRVLLFCHGNAGNISHRLESLVIFHQLGLNIFIFDYRGYGQSQGRTTEKGTYRDAQAAWDYLTVQRGFPANKIIIFGRSLGGPIAASLAAREQPAALILESTFTSLPDLGARLYPLFPVRLLSRFQYRTAAYVRRVTSPLLVVHSPSDDLVPYDLGVKVYRAASAPKEFLEIRGDHNSGFLLTGQTYVTGLRSFIDNLVVD